jgi:competence protein ComEC
LIILKIILQYKYVFISIVFLIYALIRTNFFINTSKYSIEDNVITGYIHKFTIDGDKLNIEVIGKEKIIGSYYFSTKEEKDNFKYELGDYVSIECELIKPKANTVFNLFNYKEYLLHKNIHYIMKIKNIKKIKDNDKITYKIKQLLIDRINSIKLSNKYLHAFILGEEFYISSEANDSYQINGISHLFAVSGSNITLVIVLLLKLIDKFKYKYVIVFLYVLLYMFLTDFTSSIVRSGIFFILITLNKIYKLNIKTINLLLLTLVISLLFDPYLIYSVGYQFSFIISLYLIAFQELIKKYKSNIGTLFIVSVISFLSSIPIVLNNSFEINFLSILLNIVYVPFVSIILFPLSFLCFIFPFLDSLLYILIIILENTSVFFSNIKVFTITLGKPSFILIIIYYITSTFVLYKMKNNDYKFILLLIPLFIIHSISNKNIYPEITIIDVGQGDSILLRLNSKNILLDTGGIITYNKKEWQKKNNNYSLGRDTIIPYLKSLGISKLDYLIISHGDYDHMGEVINIVEDFKVENVIFNCGPYNYLEKCLIEVLENKNIKYYSCIEELNIDKYKLQFLNTKEYDNENDNSNVIYFNYNNYKFLFMGDAGVEKEKDILEKYDLKDIDFIKIGHHGSNTSSSKEFIYSINPKYSLISVGENNKYGHPKESILDTLTKSKIYRTDIEGSIEIKLNKNGYKIRTCNP